jgi:quercetin dioxygenase-like cupin family protein
MSGIISGLTARQEKLAKLGVFAAMADRVIRPVTDDERSTWPASGLVPLSAPFSDSRGAIQPLVDAPIRSAVLISSKQGSVRANHYHRTDWHYCYVVTGSIEYFHRPTGSEQEPQRVLVTAGQMFFTPPMTDHTMIFPEDTTFLTLGRNPRDQESYEADVVRITLRNP